MKEPMFPILGDEIIKAIPWAAIKPHEKQAMRNHSQTLERLASRGGLAVYEAVWVMKDCHLGSSTQATPILMMEYRRILMVLLREFERSRATPAPGQREDR